jgi:hypothetical protein
MVSSASLGSGGMSGHDLDGAGVAVDSEKVSRGDGCRAVASVDHARYAQLPGDDRTMAQRTTDIEKYDDQLGSVVWHTSTAPGSSSAGSLASSSTLAGP